MQVLRPLAEEPDNAFILDYLRGRSPGSSAESPVEGANTWQLGTHPDLVNYLWYRLGESLPCDSRRIAYGAPVLAHPDTDRIFALAGGTRTLALRLPPTALSEALAIEGYGLELRYPGTTLHSAELGPNWAFVDPFSEPVSKWCRCAYDAADR